MKNFIIIFLMIFKAGTVEASLQNANRTFQTGDKNRYPQLVSELINNKMYFSATPFLKEYLATTTKTNELATENMVDQLISEVGIRQFEVLPVNVLEKSQAPTIRYILARKFFRQGKYDQAIKYLEKPIGESNSVKPFALLLEGSILSVTNKGERAVSVFKSCIDVSTQHINRTKDKERLWQLKINKDYCLVGIARTEFALKRHDAANLSYLDLQKSSRIWPEILFEEAWNSFYMKDYNRTLGKLVTYKAPVFQYIFNPEIEVLNALSYMELCLWDDSKKVVENFYTKYETQSENYKKYIDSLGKDYTKFYTLMKDKKDDKSRSGTLLQTALAAISRDSTYRELMASYTDAHLEIEKVNSMESSKFKSTLLENLKESLNLQRDLIGGYVKAQMQLFSAQMVRAFEDMSYIKLEILSKRKTELYEQVSLRGERARGDFKYVNRTDKQYFWDFRGEFWADELGDYVFALRSECK